MGIVKELEIVSGHEVSFFSDDWREFYVAPLVSPDEEEDYGEEEDYEREIADKKKRLLLYGALMTILVVIGSIILIAQW